jgi:hypothetical protein
MVSGYGQIDPCHGAVITCSMQYSLQHCYCSLLLPAAACPAGESGLGKTTFINNLTSSFRVVNGGRVQDGSSTTLSQFQADPDSLRTVLEPMDIPESSRRLMISIQVRF